MTREKFLTQRWNNVLSVVLGLPILIYVVVALTTSGLPDRAAFIGLVICGVVY